MQHMNISKLGVESRLLARPRPLVIERRLPAFAAHHGKHRLAEISVSTPGLSTFAAHQPFWLQQVSEGGLTGKTRKHRPRRHPFQDVVLSTPLAPRLPRSFAAYNRARRIRWAFHAMCHCCRVSSFSKKLCFFSNYALEASLVVGSPAAIP